MKSKIAVVTPVYNGEKLIQNAINSLLKQTFKNWISIIVNDGSTDQTETILKKYNKDPRFVIIEFKKNKGRPYARQAALEKVKELGVEYMAMLDADDWYYPDKLEFQYNFMQKHNNISLLSISLGLANKKNELFGISEPYNKNTSLYFSKLDDYVTVPHASSIIRVSDLEGVSYDMSMVYGQDQDFLRRFLLNKKYMFIPEIKYIYTREQSFSYSKYSNTKRLFLKSYYKLPISNYSKFKAYFLENFKCIVVLFIFKLRLNELYFKQISRKPRIQELKDFVNFRNEIST